MSRWKGEPAALPCQLTPDSLGHKHMDQRAHFPPHPGVFLCALPASSSGAPHASPFPEPQVHTCAGDPGPWEGWGLLLHRAPRHPPVYSGKQMVRGDFLIFSPKRSFLLRKRMMEVSMKNLLLQMESKSMRDSCMRFCGRRREGESGTDSERETRRQGERRIRFEREELGYSAAQEGLPGPWLPGRRTDRIVICYTARAARVQRPDPSTPLVQGQWQTVTLPRLPG